MSNQILTVEQYHFKTAVRMYEFIKTEKQMTCKDFCNACITLAMLEAQCAVTPSKYVLSQRSFTSRQKLCHDHFHDEIVGLQDLPTQMWCGYCQNAKNLPAEDFIIVDLGKTELKFFWTALVKT